MVPSKTCIRHRFDIDPRMAAVYTCLPVQMLRQSPVQMSLFCSDILLPSNAFGRQTHVVQRNVSTHRTCQWNPFNRVFGQGLLPTVGERDGWPRDSVAPAILDMSCKLKRHTYDSIRNIHVVELFFFSEGKKLQCHGFEERPL